VEIRLPLECVYTEETDSLSLAPYFCVGKGLNSEAFSHDMQCHLMSAQWLSGSGLIGGVGGGGGGG
jgi:hypothetical protein